MTLPPSESTQNSLLTGILEEIHTNPHSKETLDLMHTLESIDISDIESIIFRPRKGAGFYLQTEYMKRLSVYITMKQGKNTFQPHELDQIFSYVSKHLPDMLPPGERVHIETLLQNFINEGGVVTIRKRHIGQKIFWSVITFLFLGVLLAGGIFLSLCGGMLYAKDFYHNSYLISPVTICLIVLFLLFVVISTIWRQ